MQKFNIDLDSDSAPVLDRIIEAYGFGSKMMLAHHFGMAASSLSGRYRRGGFPADMVVKCMAETGARLEWLATGKGAKTDDATVISTPDSINIPRKKLVDGQLYADGYIVFDKSIFLPGTPQPSDPICVVDGHNQYLIDLQFNEIYDGDWLIEIEGKINARVLTRIPVKKVKISGAGIPFDCSLDDINVIGRILLTIK